MHHHVPKPVLLAAAAGLLVLLWWRHHKSAQAAAGATADRFPVQPIPVSFSYLQDNAPTTDGVVPAPGIDNASLMLLQQLQSALVSNAAAIAGLVPRSVGVSNSTTSSNTSGSGGGGFEQPFAVSGFSADQIAAAAARYAAGRSYGGASYVPHSIVQEGTVSYQGGKPGIYVKYQTGNLSTTEWTPL